MANRRMISSSTWEDDFFGELDFFQRCLWIGLFSSCADDQGRMQDNTILIRAKLFPYDDIGLDSIEDGLKIFESNNKILRYKKNGKKLIQILKWWDNQKLRWATYSKYPEPDNWIDKIRTRENNKYITKNWDIQEETEQQELNNQDSRTKGSYEEHKGGVLSGQVNVPVPVNVPIPVKYPVHDDESKNHANFYVEFQANIGIPLMGGKDTDYLADLQKEHGDAKILEIATWLKARDPDINSVWKALRAIDTAARNWSNGKKNGKVNIEAVLKEMMEESDGK